MTGLVVHFHAAIHQEYVFFNKVYDYTVYPCKITCYLYYLQIATTEQAEEVGTLLQQPLALGYLVSTAPTGRMPPWFWAACPHLENVCPVFLKNALHLHSPAIQQNSDDLLQQQNAPTAHPLDSQYTTDVLRFVFVIVFVIFVSHIFVARNSLSCDLRD